jgi:hypothetical protein
VIPSGSLTDYRASQLAETRRDLVRQGAPLDDADHQPVTLKRVTRAEQIFEFLGPSRRSRETWQGRRLGSVFTATEASLAKFGARAEKRLRSYLLQAGSRWPESAGSRTA